MYFWMTIDISVGDLNDRREKSLPHIDMLVGLKVLNNKNGGGSGMWQIFIRARTQTVMIEFYLKFEHAAFVYNTYFLIRSLLAKIRRFLKIREHAPNCSVRIARSKKEHFIFIFYILLFTQLIRCVNTIHGKSIPASIY